ncbi:PREDICTED: uncharacterized protein LOC106742469 isoform X1 [Dinoponera quadriceps]|uniref:Uncharacterized protein LOC106742469 isoform X1 n=1 Tax=Dinoponera quadriceps TaxID=609295 RepID=A0A6P3WXQ9_DINQU|nr:PREDICTED: uncharacterized protein LOC106742469 isoform X1 [Dinoponera quadriceps]
MTERHRVVSFSLILTEPLPEIMGVLSRVSCRCPAAVRQRPNYTDGAAGPSGRKLAYYLFSWRRDRPPPRENEARCSLQRIAKATIHSSRHQQHRRLLRKMLARGILCALCSALLLLNLNLAEWVDMPQFSDENKIYRIPSVQPDQFYKFRRGDADNHGFLERNSSRASRRPVVKVAHATDRKIAEIKGTHSVPESITASYLFPVQIADAYADMAEENRGPESTGDVANENKFSYGHRATPDTTTYNALTTQSPSSSTIPAQGTPWDESYNRTLKQEDGILQYLPVDVLKSVHRTLQSQPVSLEGKIHFLKTFEKTLMSEIESRLATAMAPRRRTRGAHYHGHYDDHEDHSVGFPSIEGALMAISFLTFAVYLVRLVMLLFRNITNPMTTTTAATLLLGRRKRFTADFDDDTARILGNLNSFVSNF